MVRHLHLSPTCAHLLGTAAVLAAVTALLAPAAQAGSWTGSGGQHGTGSGSGRCEQGAIPREDVTVLVAGAAYDAAWLAENFQQGAAALAPLDQVQLSYDPDDNPSTADVPPAGCTRGFQLETFATEGADWPSSGTQTWADGDGATMSAAQPVLTLAVQVPGCFHQTDLSSQGSTFEESDYYDGHDADHPVPAYPDVHTPHGLIAASSGGEQGCGEIGGSEHHVNPASPQVSESCSSAGLGLRVPLDDHLRWSYSLDGAPAVPVTRERTVVPVEEDAGYTLVVMVEAVGGASLPGGAQDEWTFDGVRDCVQDVPPPATTPEPTAQVDCAAGGGLVLTVTPADGLAWTYALDGAAPVPVTEATTTIEVAEDATWSLVVTATAGGGGSSPGTPQEWTLTGTRDCSQVQDSQTTPPTTPATTPDDSPGEALAMTGGDPRLGALAATFLVGGAGLVHLGRQRRRARHRA